MDRMRWGLFHLIDAPIGRIDQMVRRPAVGRKNISPKAKKRIAEDEKTQIEKYHDGKVLEIAVNTDVSVSRIDTVSQPLRL